MIVCCSPDKQIHELFDRQNSSKTFTKIFIKGYNFQGKLMLSSSALYVADKAPKHKDLG